MKIVVLIPPMMIIGEVKADSADELFGKPMALERPAAFQHVMQGGAKGPVPMIQFAALGEHLYFPASSPWPWRPPSQDEIDGYRKLLAQQSGLVVTNQMPRPTPIRS